MNTLDLVVILLAIEFLIISACVLLVTFYIIKTLKSFSNAANSVSKMRWIAALPALGIAIVSRIFKKRG